MWNAVAYFEDLQKKLKLTKTGYKFCRVTGINYLEEILLSSPAEKNFFAVNDVDDGVTIQKGGGFFQRRAIVVFILKRYNATDMVEREVRLNETRLICDKLMAKLIKDSNEVPALTFLDKTRFPYKEVPGYWAIGTCGKYFIFTIDEPKSLIHNQDDWD